MKDSTYFKVLLLKEKKKVKTSIRRELMLLGFRKPKIKKGQWQRSRGRESRF